jgi:hypothetical protein
VRCSVWLSYRGASPGASDILLLLSLLCFSRRGFNKCVINIPVTYNNDGSKNEDCGLISEYMHMAASLLYMLCMLYMLWLCLYHVLAFMKERYEDGCERTSCKVQYQQFSRNRP